MTGLDFQMGAALLQTKLRRKVSIRYMRAEGSYCLEFGGISTLQRDIWCTHGRYHLLSDDTSAACRACNAPHDLLLLFSVESRFIRKRLDIWLGVGYRSTDCHERPALSDIVRSVAGATCSRRVIREQVMSARGCTRYPVGVSISPRIRGSRSPQHVYI